jgi:hypothetical protein
LVESAHERLPIPFSPMTAPTNAPITAPGIAPRPKKNGAPKIAPAIPPMSEPIPAMLGAAGFGGSHGGRRELDDLCEQGQRTRCCDNPPRHQVRLPPRAQRGDDHREPRSRQREDGQPNPRDAKQDDQDPGDIDHASFFVNAGEALA